MPYQVVLQQLVDALPDHIAVVAEDGTIICVNEAWRQFSSANEGDENSFYVGQNYLRQCRESSGSGSEIAALVEPGLLRVLTDGNEFHAEYPCHGPSEMRWFEVIARPFQIDRKRFALVAHRNVTTEKRYKDQVTHADQDAKNLAAIIATMPDAMIACDMEGRITNWNLAAQKLYGYERSDVIGETLELLYPPNWPKGVQDYIADVVVNGLGYYEAVRLTKTGKSRAVEVTAAPVRSTTGEIIGVSNIHRDVTQQRDAHVRFRRTLDNLFAFVGVLDVDGTLVETNRAPLEAADLEENDVIGKKFWDCYWWSYSTDIQSQLTDACKRACAGEVVRYDVQVRIAGDRLLWIDFQIAPLLDTDGKVANLVPSGIDISERNAAAEALSASHDAFQNIVKHSPFGIFTVDADFRLAHVSDGAQKAFANVRPLVGHDFAAALRILWPEPFASEAIERFRHTLATGEPYRSPRTTERRHDIEQVESYDWIIERIKLPDGRPGVVCNFYDLSERAQHEEQIRMLMREVNHRAKNLLTIVISMARQTARDVAPHDFIKQFSQRLLGLSASQDLIVRGNWEGVTVEDLVKSQIKHLGQEILCKRIEMQGPDVQITPASAQGIGMALHELSTNALKYGSLSIPQGTVSIVWDLSPLDQSFHIQWSEHNGPPVMPPDNTGFGRIVIEKMAAISVGGEVELKYASAGVQWTLTAPLSNILETLDIGLV